MHIYKIDIAWYTTLTYIQTISLLLSSPRDGKAISGKIALRLNNSFYLCPCTRSAHVAKSCPLPCSKCWSWMFMFRAKSQSALDCYWWSNRKARGSAHEQAQCQAMGEGQSLSAPCWTQTHASRPTATCLNHQAISLFLSTPQEWYIHCSWSYLANLNQFFCICRILIFRLLG